MLLLCRWDSDIPSAWCYDCTLSGRLRNSRTYYNPQSCARSERRRPRHLGKSLDSSPRSRPSAQVQGCLLIDDRPRRWARKRQPPVCGHSFAGPHLYNGSAQNADQNLESWPFHTEAAISGTTSKAYSLLSEAIRPRHYTFQRPRECSFHRRARRKRFHFQQTRYPGAS